MRASSCVAATALIVTQCLLLQDSDPVWLRRRAVPVSSCSDFESGDLVFRMGRGLFSDIFSSFGTNHPRYSHVGIVIVEADACQVVHTEASELTGKGNARIESMAVFLGPDRAAYGAVFRVRNMAAEQRRKVVASAASYVRRQIPFDIDFNLESEDKLYCTELVWRAFREGGIDLAPKRDIVKSRILFGSKMKEIVTVNNLVEGGGIEFLRNVP